MSSQMNAAESQVQTFARRLVRRFGARTPSPVTTILYGVSLIACLILQGFASIKPFSLSVIGGDNSFTLNFAKNYINGNGFRINPDLGFPGVQDNLFFPSFDFSFRLFLRLVGVFATEAATSYYLMYFVGVCAMFAATAFALRSLGFRHSMVAVGTIVYVVSPYFVFRSLNHDFLALYFSAPLGAALALRIGIPSSDLAPRQFVTQLGVMISLLFVATSGLYYAFFSILFISFAGAIASLSQRRYQPIFVAAVCSLIVFPLLVLTGFGTGIVDVLAGNTAMVRRFAFEQLNYGLTLAEATHVFAELGPLKRIHEQYASITPHLSFAAGLQEWPGVLLTAVILGSPLVTAVTGSIRGERSPWVILIFLASTFIVFGIIYSINGGLGYYFNVFVSPAIRATARVMPFLSFFALVAFLAIVEILIEANSRLSKCTAIGSIALLVASMLPTVGKFGQKQKYITVNPAVQHDVGSIKSVLREKDRAHLTAILQLPHAPWPEAGPIRGFELYSMLKYFILDAKGSPTKWSYGGAPQQDAFIAITKLLQQHQQSGLATGAKRLGFDGILLEKSAFEEAALLETTRNIESNSGACKIFEDRARLLYTLKLSSCN